MQIDSTTLKIDKPNAKAMIQGFRKNNKLRRQSIWLAVRDRAFPVLLTLQRTPTRFKLSHIGQAMDAESFAMPLKFIATLDSEYFIRNKIPLWQTLCSNGLFDIWEPRQPYLRFAQARSDSAKFRIQLLRIYEINHEFRTDDINPVSFRVDKLVSPAREVTVKMPLIDENEFDNMKELLKRSVVNYLTRPPRHVVSSSEMAESITDTLVRNDIASLEIENEYFEGKRSARLSSFYERNPRLRAAAVRHHGTICSVCSFNFTEVYGNMGDGFIEVHHLIPVRTLTESRSVDPVSEMTVVCSNCHRMIHQNRDNVMAPEQLKKIVKRRKGN